VIDRLVNAGAPVNTCCRILGVSRQGYYRYRKRPTSATELRRRWLAGLIREIHVASRGTYGYRRIHAELTIGMGIPSLEPAHLRADDTRQHRRTARPGLSASAAWRPQTTSSTGSSTACR
jgi:hypothetical protein